MGRNRRFHGGEDMGGFDLAETGVKLGVEQGVVHGHARFLAQAAGLVNGLQPANRSPCRARALPRGGGAGVPTKARARPVSV